MNTIACFTSSAPSGAIGASSVTSNMPVLESLPNKDEIFNLSITGTQSEIVLKKVDAMQAQ